MAGPYKGQDDDIHAIRQRYCGPPTTQPQPFGFSANQGQTYKLEGTGVNAIILTVMTGQVNGYFGDFSSGFGKSAQLPHFVGSATITVNTQVIPITPGFGDTFTLQEGLGAATTGCITFIWQ